ncbi:MAG: hypothetical protein AAFY71_07870 [Bacteroidota bacterium]
MIEKKLAGTKKLFVSAKELACIPGFGGYSLTTLHRYLKRIREHVNKSNKELVTIYDVADYLRVPVGLVESYFLR